MAGAHREGLHKRPNNIFIRKGFAIGVGTKPDEDSGITRNAFEKGLERAQSLAVKKPDMLPHQPGIFDCRTAGGKMAVPE